MVNNKTNILLAMDSIKKYENDALQLKVFRLATVKCMTVVDNVVNNVVDNL